MHILVVLPKWVPERCTRSSEDGLDLGLDQPPSTV